MPVGHSGTGGRAQTETAELAGIIRAFLRGKATAAPEVCY